MSNVTLLGLKVIVVNRQTKREWKASLDAEGVLCANIKTQHDDGVSVNEGAVDVLVEGKPLKIEYKVVHTTKYLDKLSVTTEVVSIGGEPPTKEDRRYSPNPIPNTPWQVRLVPILDIAVDPALHAY